MLIADIKKSNWLQPKSKRRGRWDGSGRGNYSTRWQKGQWSRSWGSMPSWFEGGQTPLNLRLPKLRGFKRPEKFKKNYVVINVQTLEKDENIKADSTIDKKTLIKLKYIKKEDQLVKILATWTIKKSLTFKGIDAVSASAQKKIEKAWGKIE